MYVYFNELGVIKEIVQNEHLRQGSSNANELYLYFAGDRTLSQLTLTIQVNDSEETTYTRFIDLQEDKVENVEIPYNTTQQLKYFSYYTPYTMYKYTFVDDDLAYDGVLKITPRAYFDGGNEAQGEILLMVEESVIVNNPQITRAEYENLLNEINKVKNMKAKLYRHSMPIVSSQDYGAIGVNLIIYSNRAEAFPRDIAELSALLNTQKYELGENTTILSGSTSDKTFFIQVSRVSFTNGEVRMSVKRVAYNEEENKYNMVSSTISATTIGNDTIEEIPLSLE